MSDFTQTLYETVNSLTYNSTAKNIHERITLACPMIFNFDYELWSSEYKPILEKKIISRYLMKERCVAEFELWQFYLCERLNTIMPYYNNLYKSTIVEYDITKDHSETITSKRDKNTTNDLTNKTISDGGNTIDGTNAVNSTQDNSGETSNYDVPQTGYNTESDFRNSMIRSKDNSTGTNNNTTHSTSTNTNENNVTQNIKNNDIENVLNTTSGNSVSISELIVKYRDSLINIDNMIINELDDLFMRIYKLY